MKRVLLFAGEASGDLHAAHLAKALKSRAVVSVGGTGGPLLKEQADGPFYEMAGTNVTGISAVVKRLPYFLRLLSGVERRAAAAGADALVFIDNPGFNLRLAKRLARLGKPMVYYICPQIWVWHPERVHLMKRLFRKALVVFDFERDIYEKNGMPVSWVGHPLLDVLGAAKGDAARETRRVLLMPGSRVNEVKTLLPILLGAAAKLKERVPDALFTLVKADTLDDAFYAPYIAGCPIPLDEVRADRYRAMARAALALACSGTATLEAALLRLPSVVVNRGSLLTYLTARALIRVKHLALPNILAGETVVPELLQYDCTPGKIAAEAADILTNAERKRRMEDAFAGIARKVGGPGASARAAQEILSLI